MGKRKSSKKPQAPKRKTAPLDTDFTCLFCHHEKAVSCKMNKKESVGHISCKVCGQSYQCPIHHLSEPIDVYTEWMDATEAAQENANKRRAALSDEE